MFYKAGKQNIPSLLNCTNTTKQKYRYTSIAVLYCNASQVSRYFNVYHTPPMVKIIFFIETVCPDGV